MAVTIVGAGAIGGVTGASLARAGHDVLLVDQAADHVAAMNEGGLEIATPAGAQSVYVDSGGCDCPAYAYGWGGPSYAYAGWGSPGYAYGYWDEPRVGISVRAPAVPNAA